MNNYRKRGSSVVSALASRAKGTGINPGVGKGISVSEYAFFRVICRDNNKRVSRPSDRDVNWSPPPHPRTPSVQGKSPPVQVKKPYGNSK